MIDLPHELLVELRSVIDVAHASRVAGGDINEARKIISTDGRAFFLKFNAGPEAEQMFNSEVRSLLAIQKTKVIPVPRIVHQGNTGSIAFLLLEFLESKPPTGALWKKFGESLAQLHGFSTTLYGSFEDNFIGRLPQSNANYPSWIPFFIEQRLIPQIQLAKKGGLISTTIEVKFEVLFKRLPELLEESKPALLHGDLWSGNYLMNGTSAYLIDPASYYGHPEIDLAMTLLFGGFDRLFYESYEANHPLSPDWPERIKIYQLYYLLVHVNLFGRSYLSSVESILSRFA